MRGVVGRLAALATVATFALPGTSAAAGLPSAPSGPPGAVEPVPMTAPQAVDEALDRAPELLDSVDQAAQAGANLSGVRSLFLPQVRPFFARTTPSDGSPGITRAGALLTQQFTFGTRVTASASTEGLPDGTGYTSAHSVLVEQALLKNADPVVPRQPLHVAERAVETGGRSLTVVRRRTVAAAWAALLGVALGDELVAVARERTGRAERLASASDAKFEAGSVSRLDVLRARQLVASSLQQENSAASLVADAADALARLLGRSAGTRFAVTPPERLPVDLPPEAAAIEIARERREDVAEAVDQVRDAEILLRIAKSQVLPTLGVVGGWTASGFDSTGWGALTRPGPASLTLGLRSEADLNLGSVLSAKAQAEIQLRTARRHLELLREDVSRAVARAYRDLGTARSDLEINEANLEVARSQLEVASLRYEKGLNSNFDVVDAENLYNQARISVLTSRNAVLLGEVNVLVESGLLKPEQFGRGGDR